MVAVSGSCRADEFYFVLVFGAQRVPNRPKYSHSFATFVHAVGQGPDIDTYALEAHTISWLPETMDIHVCRPLPERGRNFDLDTTLQGVRRMCDRVSMWGPYQIRRELYDSALEQIARLESGAVQYKAVDVLHRTWRTSNCIHALSDVLNDQGRLWVLSPGFGENASAHIVSRYAPWLIDPDQVHDWVALRLGVDTQTVIRREFSEKPHSVHRSFVPASSH
jgi:hypothetical protein